MDYNSLVEKTWGVSQMMCSVANVSLFTTVAVANEYGDVLAAKKGWTGEEPEEKSCAPFVGPWKVEGLLLDLNDDFAMTPTGHPLACPWMGGIRQRVEKVHNLTSGSAWTERCDALHALTINYTMDHEVLLHHIGRRHSTIQSLNDAVKADEEKLGVQAIYLPTGEDKGYHERYYLLVEYPTHPYGHFWIEHQFFPRGSRKLAIHWDFFDPLVADDEIGIVGFVGHGLGTKPTTWKAGPNDPVGLVGETNRDGVIHQIMGRPNWWEIKPER